MLLLPVHATLLQNSRARPTDVACLGAVAAAGSCDAQGYLAWSRVTGKPWSKVSARPDRSEISTQRLLE